MNTVHFILQGKGGVGKSLVSSMLFQYIQKNKNCIGIDTDPVNATFSRCVDLNVKQLNIMDDDDIDPRKFDTLMEQILETDSEDKHIIIDNGASSFIPLCSYLKENNAIDLIKESGNKVVLHSIITGGQALGDTLAGLGTLASSFDAPIVVWLNLYFGDIFKNGKTFEEFKIYQEYGHKFQSIIHIPLRKKATFGKDLEDLFSSRETFDTAINNSKVPIMVRQRLKTFWSEVQGEIDKAQLI
ncbi:nucleotide-binding protein [Desulfocastanea catecholica]